MTLNIMAVEDCDNEKWLFVFFSNKYGNYQLPHPLEQLLGRVALARRNCRSVNPAFDQWNYALWKLCNILQIAKLILLSRWLDRTDWPLPVAINDINTAWPEKRRKNRKTKQTFSGSDSSGIQWSASCLGPKIWEKCYYNSGLFGWVTECVVRIRWL